MLINLTQFFFKDLAFMKAKVVQRCFLMIASTIFVAGCSPDGSSTAEKDQEKSMAVEAVGGGETLKSVNDFATSDEKIANRDTLPGAKIYTENCAFCHDGSVSKAPQFNWLEMMPPASIVNALSQGVMIAQGKGLTPDEHLQLAEYITRVPVSGGLPEEPLPPMCEAEANIFDPNKPPATVGWGHDARRMISSEIAGLSASDLSGASLKWAFAFPNATRARSQPAIGYGAVYVGSESGAVYAFDLESGCVRWTFQASAEVRTAVVLQPATSSEKAKSRPLVFFGDIIAKMYAVNALTGELVWSRKIDEHPSATLTATPLFYDNMLYVPVSSLEVIPAANPAYPCCSFRGQIAALDAETGDVDWNFFPIPNPPVQTSTTKIGTPVLSVSGTPIWVSPTIDTKRGLLYFGTGENYSTPADENSDAIFAIDLKTGERRWQRQTVRDDAWNVACMMLDNPNCPKENGPDFDHSSSIVLVDFPDGSQSLVTGHKNGNVMALDPDNEGKLLWETKVGRGSIQGGVHFGIAVDGTTIYVPINDMNNTHNGQYLDPEASRAGIHAVDAVTGELLWSNVQENVCGTERPFCDPGISSAVTALDGGVIAGHMDGHIRAYDKKTGEVIWDVDTTLPIETVNGLVAKGGSMSGPGAAVQEGYIAINSGYGLYYHEPGNLFMVFSVKKPDRATD